MRVLSIVFGRLYVLRNRLIHGGATWNSEVNHNQVRDGSDIIGRVSLVVIHLLMDRHGALWGGGFVSGGGDRWDWIIERRWRQFADDIGVGYKLVRQTLMLMKELVSDAANEQAAPFHADYGHCAVIDRIVAVIEMRKTRITNALGAAEQ